MNKPYVTAAVLAAGLGSRFSTTETKQKTNLLGKSVVRRAVELFDKAESVDDIIVVVRQDEKDFVKSELREIKKPVKLVIGGNFRAESAKNAFLALNPKADFIAIHDAARCITAISDIENVINDAIKFGAATASREVFDTVKLLDTDGLICSTQNRDTMRFVETPQVFSVSLYKKAISEISALDAGITDDNMLMEKIGVKVFPTKMEYPNVKITTPSDIFFAEFILKGKTYNE